MWLQKFDSKTVDDVDNRHALAVEWDGDDAAVFDNAIGLENAAAVHIDMRPNSISHSPQWTVEKATENNWNGKVIYLNYKF